MNPLNHKLFFTEGHKQNWGQDWIAEGLTSGHSSLTSHPVLRLSCKYKLNMYFFKIVFEQASVY